MALENQKEKKPTKKPTKKLKRVPLFKQQNIEICGDPNFHYHIVKDKDDRVNRFLDGGYVFAEASEINRKSNTQNAVVEGREASRVSMGIDGAGYLMKIPERYYKEDQALKRHERLIRRQGEVGKIKNISSALQCGRVTIDEDIRS